MKNKLKASHIILPMLFCSTVVFVGFINISNFKNSYKVSIEENPNNRQLGLSKIEGKYAENFEGKNNFITLNGAFTKLMDKESLNGIVKLENGHLTTLTDKANTAPLVETTAKFNDYLNKKDIPFLYTQLPDKMPTDDSYLPKGHVNFINENADNLLKGLEENNIDTLDIRYEIQKNNIDNYSLFFKTDHHWNFNGAFWSHTKIVEKINSLLNIDNTNQIYFDINNYNVEKYEDIFLGSRGKRVGPYFGGVDDIDLITPKFDTSFTLEVPSRNIKREGNFNESLLFMEQLENKDYYSSNPYSVYLKQDYDYMKIKNNNIDNNKKIFIIKDSFGIALAPFLALHYGEVHLYDLRPDYVGGNMDDMISKIESIKPDLVACMYFPGVINSGTFNFINDEIIKKYE